MTSTEFWYIQLLFCLLINRDFDGVKLCLNTSNGGDLEGSLLSFVAVSDCCFLCGDSLVHTSVFCTIYLIDFIFAAVDPNQPQLTFKFNLFHHKYKVYNYKINKKHNSLLSVECERYHWKKGCVYVINLWEIAENHVHNISNYRSKLT